MHTRYSHLIATHFHLHARVFQLYSPDGSTECAVINLCSLSKEILNMLSWNWSWNWHWQLGWKCVVKLISSTCIFVPKIVLVPAICWQIVCSAATDWQRQRAAFLNRSIGTLEKDLQDTLSKQFLLVVKVFIYASHKHY